jgi:hypothetical protein
MLKSSSETVIRQYDTRTGKQLYERVHRIGVKNPTLVGGRLVGVEYKPSEAMAPLSPGQLAAGIRPPPVKTPGVVAFKLK